MQEYDLYKIGQRIFEEQQKVYVWKNRSEQYHRENGCIQYSHIQKDGYKPATQKDILNIAAELGYHFGRNTLSDIQNGKKHPKDFSLEELAALCTIYDCEIGYLLCEQDQPYKATEDIMKATSLSADAVKALLSIKAEDKEGNVLSMLSFCMADGNGCYIPLLMQYFRQFIDNITLEGTTKVMKDAEIHSIFYAVLEELRNDYVSSDATIQKELKKKRKEQKQQQINDNLIEAAKKHLAP